MSAKASHKPQRPSIRPSIFYLASLLFFVSGGTGLVYQVVWFKRFSHVWGSSSLAFAAVAGSFLFGLGLGAYLFGRYADRMASPLRWYGLCELAIGLVALVIPLEIGLLADASAMLYARIPEQPLARYFVQFVITMIVIGPPCVLMGGTLPLLIRELTARTGPLDQATGWLYAVNTFGAAAGCYLAGFHLLPSFGLWWTNNLSAAVNLAIGATAILVSRWAERRLPTPARPPTTAKVVAALERSNFALVGLYFAAAVSGCAALILEMTWSRQLALILGGSTYAYTAALFIVLVGIAGGSLLFHAALRRVASSAVLPVAIVGVLALATLAGKLALPWLSLAVAPESVRVLRADQLTNGAICAAVSAALELGPALAMGVLFPLFVHLTRAGAAHVGRAVGNVYAFNTLGSIAGGTLTAAILFPWIGTAGAMGLAVAMYIAALAAITPWRTRAGTLIGGVSLAAGAVIVVALARPIDPRLTNMGFYLYGDPRVAQDGTAKAVEYPSSVTVTFFREGASSNVFVGSRKGGNVSLRVNGKADASSNVDMENQLGLAYIPRLFTPDARQVMVIGYGSGCTPGAALMFPGTRVTCCEIEPAVYAATDAFAEQNHRPNQKSRRWLEARNAELPAEKRLSAEQIEAQARFSIIFGDGRTALAGSDAKYDLIISEPSNPWLAGVSNLFTKEFFRATREHLTDRGVLAQWIQTYNFTIDDYLMIVRTLRAEFPFYGVLIFSGGADTVLLASSRPLFPTPDQIAALQKTVDGSPEMTKDFKVWFGGTDLRWLLLQYYRIGKEQLDRLVDGAKVQDLNTDLHLRLEFDAPLYLFRSLPPRESAMSMLRSAADPQWLTSLAQRIGVRFDSSECHQHLGQYLVNQLANPGIAPQLQRLGHVERAANHFEEALALDSGNLDAYRGLARVRRLQERRQEAASMFAEVLRKLPNDPLAHAELATEVLSQKKAEQAIRHYRQALRLLPAVSLEDNSLTWANNLAWILSTNPDAKLRNGSEAVDWARKACQADGYKHPVFLDTLASALAEAGQFQEAIKVSRQLIQLADGQPELVKTAKDRIRLYEASQAYREY
jgi:predicted membrane-bound spermidine synthase/tetratricopeptide (TPR) repeat protein